MRRSLSAVEDAPGVDRFRRLDRTTRLVVGLVVLAAVARFAFLGSRVAHFDEGRVAWWSLHFLETGQFEYRYIIHGPFVQHVDRVVFALFGASDFTMRFVVALVGALLPLSALLFREHLESDEILGVAFFLSFNPILLYYSRFFRSTLLVAAFSFVAFGLLVRAYDERSVRHAHAAVAFVALAFASKENAAVYMLVWVGALALIADHALFRTGSDESGLDWLLARLDATRDRRDRYRERLPAYLIHLAFGVILFVGISLYFYAPRTPNSDAVGFWGTVANPLLLPELFETTLDDVVTGYEYWFGGSSEPGCNEDNLIDSYLCFFGTALKALGKYALSLMVLAGFGFVAERYSRVRARNVVLFTAYWGFVSVLGYPLGTDIANAWITVNALVPLAVPAGVGLAVVWRLGRNAFEDDDPLRVGIVAFVLLLVVGHMAFGAATGVYRNSTSDDNPLVQYAQPADDFRPAMRALEGRAGDHEGTDVLFVGSTFVRETTRHSGMEPHCVKVGDGLPLQWYVAAYGGTGECELTAEGAVANMSDHDPLVVIAPRSLRSQLESELEGYDAGVYRIRTWGDETVFFSRPRGGGNATAG